MHRVLLFSQTRKWGIFMKSKIREAICLDSQPVAVIRTDTPPEGPAISFPPGARGRCLVSLLAAASQGRSAVVQADTTGCNGGKVGLGFAPMSPEPMCRVLSTGGPMEGMYYKDSPEHARCYIEGLPPVASKPYVLLRPLDQLMEGEQPACVVFLVNADQISALVTLANFDRPNQDNVKLLFGAGCSQAVLYALHESEVGQEQCSIGLTDPSARIHLNKDLLSFSIPYPRFLEMERKVEDSFLTKDLWLNLRKRIK